jgi:hypothetical protein
MRVLYIEREPSRVISYPYTDYLDYDTPVIRTLKKRISGYYKLWLHTSDRLLGTYLKLYDNGKIERVTVRADQGDEIVTIKPED